MASTPKNAGKRWTDEEIKMLRQFARQNTPTRVIALKLQRTPEAILAKASELGISLKPVNQRPYNRQTSK